VAVGVGVTVRVGVGHVKAAHVVASQHAPTGGGSPGSHTSPGCTIPSPQTGQLGYRAVSVALSVRGGLKTTPAPMTGFCPGGCVVTIVPPGLARYCELAPSCMRPRAISSMFEPPSRPPASTPA
jgi:hypothetical protein